MREERIKTFTKGVFKIFMLFFALFLSFMLKPGTAYAAKTEYVEAKTYEYTTVNSAKIKIQSGSSSNYTIYFIKNGKTYTKSVTSSSTVPSAVTNGTTVYYKAGFSGALYKWSPASDKTEKIGTVKVGNEGSFLVGGYGNNLYYSCMTEDYEAAQDLYVYSLKTKKSTRIRKWAFYVGVSGKYVILEGSHGDPSPTPMYVYNTSTKKNKKLVSKQLGGTTVSGNWIYYAKVTKSDLSTGIYTFKVQGYNLKTGKTKTFAAGLKGYYCSEITNKYIIFNKAGSGYSYKYTYATKKYTRYNG
ncbi:MAG: hypothetical protein LUG99_04090 [Lachnospiraceae bacterium]|nr:hypothetical protein [Lachnospiraceae bacterium]